jgi:hypothetical protein
MTLKELDLSDGRLRDNSCVTTNALRKDCLRLRLAL